MDCVFCKIAQGVITTECLFEDEDVMAFHDQHPQAPLHALIIPKRHISTVNDTDVNDAALLGKMLLTAKQIGATQASNGYRLVMNVNQHGGQTVYHIHLHVLGGRPMAWPPG